MRDSWPSGCQFWALSIEEKNPEISVGAKVEISIGKKLFHLVVNPGTSRCLTVDLELVQTRQTTRNVNGTRHSVRKFQPGKRAHLFRFSTFSGNFPVGRTDARNVFYLPLNRKFRKFWLNGKRLRRLVAWERCSPKYRNLKPNPQDWN